MNTQGPTDPSSLENIARMAQAKYTAVKFLKALAKEIEESDRFLEFTQNTNVGLKSGFDEEVGIAIEMTNQRTVDVRVSYLKGE